MRTCVKCTQINLCDSCHSKIELKDFAEILSQKLGEEILPEHLQNLGRNDFNTGWLIWIVPKLQIRKIDSISLDESLQSEKMKKTLRCDLVIFRCTRNEPYRNDVSGYINPGDRQGHYIQAENASKAIAKMRELFPSDTEGFTIQYWQGRPEPKGELRWVDNGANPTRLDVARSLVHLQPGESPEMGIERYLVWIADMIIGEPMDILYPCGGVIRSSEQLKKMGIVGIYAS